MAKEVNAETMYKIGKSAPPLFKEEEKMDNQHTGKTPMQIKNIPSRRHLFFLVVAAAVFFPSVLYASPRSVNNTKHNLSITGPGTIKSTSQSQVCIFCHTPHHASSITPLWSRDLSVGGYDLYASESMKATPGQPTGYSRLCLSCHDGTIALGALHGGRTIPVSGSGLVDGRLTSSNTGYLGTDLSDDHPISFPYTSELATSNGELRQPAALPAAIKLEDGDLQCTSCHNPHSNFNGKFLVMDNKRSRICSACHVKTGWAASTHGGHLVPHEAYCIVCHEDLMGPGIPSGCMACHKPHRAGFAKRLQRGVTEEGTCLRCHTAGKAQDIQTVINKSSSHPVELTNGTHESTETLPAATFHVECADCHNPHQLKDGVASAPQVNGRLTGVKGITISGELINPAVNEYEVCFRCHAESTFITTNTVTRLIENGNKRLSFAQANPSFHPVAFMGKNLNVPGLKLGYTEASMIYCTDCHNNNSSVKAGGTGANGPHGSDYEPLLIAHYETGTNVSYAAAQYALCYRCHDESTLFSSSTGFKRDGVSSHFTHVEFRGISCAVCHDPHGIPAVDGGTPTANAHLINFDLSVVAAGGSYTTNSPGSGSCTVSCHSGNPTKSY